MYNGIETVDGWVSMTNGIQPRQMWSRANSAIGFPGTWQLGAGASIGGAPAPYNRGGAVVDAGRPIVSHINTRSDGRTPVVVSVCVKRYNAVDTPQLIERGTVVTVEGNTEVSIAPVETDVPNEPCYYAVVSESVRWRPHTYVALSVAGTDFVNLTKPASDLHMFKPLTEGAGIMQLCSFDFRSNSTPVHLAAGPMASAVELPDAVHTLASAKSRSPTEAADAVLRHGAGVVADKLGQVPLGPHRADSGIPWTGAAVQAGRVVVKTANSAADALINSHASDPDGATARRALVYDAVVPMECTDAETGLQFEIAAHGVISERHLDAAATTFGANPAVGITKAFSDRLSALAQHAADCGADISVESPGVRDAATAWLRDAL